MKRLSMVLIGLISLLGSVACDREFMELSPEAAVAYGVPSQKSNSDPAKDIQKNEENHEVGSSAILPKRRIDY